MRFGVFIPQGWRLDLVGINPADQWPVMRELARYADDSPFHSIWVYDHFHTVPAPTTEATHEAWTLMAALAAVTDRVRLGQMCSCMGYRNPVYLAKVAATIDIISGGRVEMGIGAGWYEHEWRAYGYGFPSDGTRLAMLDEGVQIMRAAWRDGIVSFAGTHYQVDGAIVQPTPLQPGGIPLWIAGGGERKTLRTAAKYAQFTNFDGSPAGFAHKSAVLKAHCNEVGTDYAAIGRSGEYTIVIGATQREADEKFDSMRAHYRGLVPAADADRETSGLADRALIGTPDSIVARLQEMADLGMSDAICYFLEVAHDRSGLELFTREVIPALA
jgi:F420-dependent oxidoreductase-like protein